MDAFYRSLIPALWLIWCLYWFVAARDAKATARAESAASRLSHVLPLVFAGWLIGARRVPVAALQQPIVANHAAAYAVGLVLVAAGLGFSIWARRWLGRNWSGIVTLKQEHELVRGGPYRWVRHPIYTGLLLAFAGSALARDEWRGALAVAIAWLALWRKLRIEEGFMIERFGDAYRRFRREVPALVPNPFRRVKPADESR